jgi:hypothetical protein
MAQLSLAFPYRVEWTLSRESAFKTFGLQSKWQTWNQSEDQMPLSFAMHGNAQIRTQRELDEDKRWSVGGGVQMARHLWQERIEIAGELLGQSATNMTQAQANADHSLAIGVNGHYRMNPLAFYLEAIIPLSLGDYGYREPVSHFQTKGIPFIGAGLSYRTSQSCFEVLVTNSTSMLAANYLGGVNQSTRGRPLEWRLGFDWTRQIKLGK